MRKVRTASGAVAVRIITRQGRQVLNVEHLGSAHTDAELEVLIAVATQQLSPGQDAFDLGPLRQVPARMDAIADWTRHDILQLESGVGRPRQVAAGGRLWRRRRCCCVRRHVPTALGALAGPEGGAVRRRAPPRRGAPGGVHGLRGYAGSTCPSGARTCRWSARAWPTSSGSSSHGA